jgi:hypothetical protein
MIDEHAPHEPSRDPEKVRSILPAEMSGIRQAEKSLIDECGRLQRMPAPLPAHVAAGQPVELRLHERQELVKGTILAVAPRAKKFSHRFP